MKEQTKPEVQIFRISKSIEIFDNNAYFIYETGLKQTVLILKILNNRVLIKPFEVFNELKK